MNAVVEGMVRKAISCTGVESVVEAQRGEDLFSDEFIAHINAIEIPIMKFNALLKLLRKSIRSYRKANKNKS